jgi:PAS domain S-box-containing protein
MPGAQALDHFDRPAGEPVGAAEPGFRFTGAPGPLDLAVGMLDAVDVAVSASDLDGRIFYWNPANERLYGYLGPDILGSADVDLAAGPRDRTRLRAAGAAALSGRDWSGVCRVRHSNGGVVLLQLARSPLRLKDAVAGTVMVSKSVAADAGPVAEADWACLTDAEVKVARLVAEGLTNRETAQRLLVSQHTVDSHLKHVFTKLGLRSRVQLTRVLLARDPYDHS